MKKMTFALACASAVAASAAWEAPVLNAIGFEDYTLTDGSFTGLSNKKDNGTDASAPGDSFWLYVDASNSEDASTVKAYDSAKTGNSNYLELLTEGGTLWRSINGLSSATTLGAAQAVPADTGLYIDTMVQFTPTEDGGAPDTDPADKLAVWLNVDSSGATNLMVKASQLYTEGTDEAQHALSTNAVYVVSNPEVEIQAGKWHQLTVKVVKNILNVPSTLGNQEYVSAFEISIDGKVMAVTGEKVATDDFIAFYSENKSAGLPDCFATGAAAALQAGTLIPSLKGYTEYIDQSALQAVGFKGSGAIDSLQFTTEKPNEGQEEPAPVKVDLSISAENATVTGITAGIVEVGSNLTFTVKAAEGYNLTGVTINGTTVTADADGNYTYTVADTDEAVAVVVTVVAAAPAYPTYIPDNAAIKSKFDAWVTNKANGDRDAASANMDAFLLNVAPGEVTTAKAAFKIISIEQDAEGAWVAKVTDDVGDGEAFGNGYVVIKGSATVDGEYTLATTADTARFFKAFLVLEAPTAE